MTLPPPAGMASGLSQATSSDVGLNTGALTLAIAGTLLAAIAAGATVTWQTTRRK